MITTSSYYNEEARNNKNINPSIWYILLQLRMKDGF